MHLALVSNSVTSVTPVRTMVSRTSPSTTSQTLDAQSVHPAFPPHPQENESISRARANFSDGDPNQPNYPTKNRNNQEQEQDRIHQQQQQQQPTAQAAPTRAPIHSSYVPNSQRGPPANLDIPPLNRERTISAAPTTH